MSTQLLVFLLAGIITTFLHSRSAVAATVDSVDVSIEVSYTRPDGFTREAPYYRAASALTLTCVVAEDNGGLFYQWTSTCQGSCFVRGGTTQSVSIHALHSRDSGVHTCTVYDGLGCTGNASITVHVAGAGIYVTNGHEVLSNNGIITTQHFRQRLSEFHCISATQQYNVGNLIGPSGADVTYSYYDPFLVTRSGSYDPGLLQVRGHSAIETHDEGVYTCRIPNEFNEIVDINVGIYGYWYMYNNGPPEVTSLTHNVVRLPYTITCISTGSPPTSVVWEKDGVILVEDTINKFSQILVDRRTSTYQNVLTMDESFAVTVADYTCTVNNSFGVSNTLETSVKALEVTGYDKPLIVGLKGELTCSTHLDIRELEWYLVGIEMPLEKSSNGTLTLVVDVHSTALDGNQFTCRATTVDGGIHEETITIEVKELENVVAIAGPTNPILAGEGLQLTCIVTCDIAPQVSWVIPTSYSYSNTTDENDVYISQPVVDGNTTTLVLSIAALNTSHGGEYSCLSFVNDPVSFQTNTRDVIMKIPQPVVSLAREPTDAVIYTTSSLELSCAVLVDETVDTAVNISISWAGPSGALATGSRITISDASVSNLGHYSEVSISSLLSSDSGSYTCTVNVEPSLSSLFVESSTAFSSSTTLQAVLRVEIEVSYTAPDQYPDYHPPEYRAASAVSLHCVAHGTSGSVSYSWSSTCSGCFASSSYSQTISDEFLRSYDAGVHTCTVTDSLGNSGSGSTEMRIVGAGIYVSYNYWHTGLLSAQAVANNSMLWVRTDYLSYYSGLRLELWCCSNSSSPYIGSFVFPPGYTYNDDTGYYDIDQQSGGSYEYAGCIYFEIYDTYSYSLPYSGIYTCQIPDASGNTVDVGFGLYRQHYSYPPSFSGLYHEASTTNFTLSCQTTSYPATNVTWTRDGVPISIDQEVTKVHSIVTYAYNADYKTIFMSSEDPDDLVGNYTCTVWNQFGSDSSGELEIIGIEAWYTESLIVSGSDVFFCSSDLDILQIEWFADGSLVATSNSSVLDFFLNPISTDHQDSIYSCIVTSPYGTQERSFTLNVTVPDNWASVEIVSSTGENPINNTHYTLTCTVNGIEGMNLPAVIEWVAPNGSVITSSERITVGDEVTAGSTTTLTLTFDPVYNRDAGLYTCRAGVDVPWMSQQPPVHSATVDMMVITQAIIQLKMGPLPNCLNWDIEFGRAYYLERSVAAAIQDEVRERCSCNYLSSLSIYESEFSCQTTLTSNQMVYRARIKGTSSLLTANQILSYIEDWRDSEGTFLHQRLRLRLVQKEACPLRISSFHELDCDDGNE